MTAHHRRMGERADNSKTASNGEWTAVEATRSLRRSLPSKRWKPRPRAGLLTYAAGGFLFVFIVGAGWLFIEAGGLALSP